MSPNHLDRHRAARRASAAPAPRGAADLREQLVDAAERLLAERQVSAITTRDIARAANLSDGVLYNYFANKNDLVVAALLRRYDGHARQFEAGLPAAGSGTVEANLNACGETMFALATETLPAVAGLMSEPALLHQFMAEIHGDERGMQRMFGQIGAYLAAEQALGRLGGFDVGAAVTTFFGAITALGLGAAVAGLDAATQRAHIPAVVAILLEGIAP